MHIFSCRSACFILLSCIMLPVQAQQIRPADTEVRTTYAPERQLIETTLETIVTVLQGATFHHEEGGSLSERLRRITSDLSHATQLLTPDAHTGTPTNMAAPMSGEDMQALRDLLHEIVAEMQALREELEADHTFALADRLAPIERDLTAAARLADDLATDPADRATVTMHDGTRWLRPGHYEKRSRRPDDDHGDADGDDDAWDDSEEDDWTTWEEDHEPHRKRERDWHQQFGKRHGFGTFVGDYSYRWPFRSETALYRTIPPIRYNRVEGLVLGIGRDPLSFGYNRARVYGQVGYAFALEDIRYEVGLETHLNRNVRDAYGLKVGASYRENTTSEDRWKTSWLENSLAGFFFEEDFFDYYETEGFTFYAVQRLSPYAQFSAGYRTEEHRSLRRNTSWSLFDGNGFALNPSVDEGQVQTMLLALEGGRVEGLHHLPRGFAFRAEAELGQGFGGDYSYNRILGDARAYVPVTSFSSLALRLRGGRVDGDEIPVQKRFTLGGIGTMRGYAQNAFVGSRMLLGNAEYIINNADLLGIFDDLQVFGLFDAGWVGSASTEFDFDDVLPSAGFGLGLDDRDVRLELSWPLRGADRSPSLWLRVTPSF